MRLRYIRVGEMNTSKPFFSERLLVTAPDGSYGGLRRRRRVAAFEDRLEIGDLAIDYRYISDVRVYGNVLHVAYVASDGRQVEEFFRHDTFLERTGRTALAGMAAQVDAIRQKSKPDTSPFTSMQSAAMPIDPTRAESLEPTTNGWQRVAVYSALVAFPPVCPVCVRPAEAIGRFDASAGLNEKGAWLVPVCRAHVNDFNAHVSVTNWRADRSRLEFLIWSRDYSELFLTLNRGEESERLRKALAAAPILYDIKNGVRFVQYQFAISAVVISFLIPSDIQMLQPQESAFRRSLKYSGLSLLLGWWGIPAGPIFTIASVIRNCRGGIDLTGTVTAVLSGNAMSAGGYR